MSIISNLVRKTIKKDGPLNILSFFYDGKFDIELLDTGHEFYGYVEESAYMWPGYTDILNKNLHIMQDQNEIANIGFDLVLFNNRYIHSKFFGICRQLHVPGLIIDHDINFQNAYNRTKNKQHTPFPNVSTSDFLKNQYGSEESINYGIAEKAWEYEKDIDILCTITNQSDVALVYEIKKQFPSSVFIGNNENVPFAGVVSTYDDYKTLFKRARLFVNLSPQINLNYDILFALSNKIPVITHHLPIYKAALEQDINPIQVSSKDELIYKIKELCFDKNLYNKVSDFSTNLSKFSQTEFIAKWNDVLIRHSSRIYIE